MILRDWKWLVLARFFGRWRRPSPPLDGYTILLPSPMDMPFLLRVALEGLRHLDTSHCRQIIVIPDGFGADRGAALRQVVDSCGDSRVELAQLRWAPHFSVQRMGRSGGGIANWAHWAMIIEGINRARCPYIFLHDADAFVLESGGLERQYRECRDRGMATLGVMARWDPFFREIGYAIPGTYELMFSARWVRRYSPVDLKGRRRQTTHGLHVFDTMLYPQFQDYPSGKVGILEPPMRLVHFNGAISIYRMFCERVGQPVIDENFRMLFLALMEDLIPSPSGDRLHPSVSELARGLDDPSAAISYASPRAIRGYPTFRAMVEDLCNSPVFQGPRAVQIRASIYPFDRHYENLLGASKTAAADRPGGNVTELDGLDGSELAGKRLQLLTEIIPRLARLAVLSNPSNPSHGPAVEQTQAAATSLDVELRVARTRSPDEFESAFATVIAGRADALIVLADEMLFNNHPRILLFTDFNRLAALFPDREVAEAGGLMAYGPSVPGSLIHQCADAAESSAELATRFEFAINLRTAAALGLAVPPTLLALADTVTE
jgi:hypothetical protein